MKKNLLLIIFAIICFTMLLGVIFTGCTPNALGKGDNVGGRTERYFMALSDYNSVKDDIYGSDLVNNSIKDKATEELIVGQTYCFLYIFELKDIAPMMSERALYNYFSVSLKTWGGIYYGADAVDFVGFEYDDRGMDADFNCDYGALTLSKKSEGYYEDGLYHHYKSYVCIQFNPKYAGSIYVESNIYGEWYKKAEDNKQWISANIFNSESEIINSDKCNIKSLSYGFIDGETYNSGLLKEDTELGSISNMTIGDNYIIVDFDIEAIASSGTKNVFCGIYLHEGSWENATLEQANTATYSQIDMEDGTMFDFSYKVPDIGSKKVRTIIRFTALDACLVKLDLYMYGGGSTITGTTFAGVYFSEKSVAELKYEIDEDLQICRVTGFENYADNVIIPDRYQGYPVLEIAGEAFAQTSIVSLSIGNRVQSVGFGAFNGCDQLSEVVLGNNVNTICERAFEDCASLKRIQLPASLYSIGANAFRGCSNLESAEFENKIGWQLLASNADQIYSGYFPVSDSGMAAISLTDTYSHIGWYYCAVAEIDNTNIGAILESEYNEGMVNPGCESLNNLTAGKEYIFILEFDIIRRSQVIDPITNDDNSIYVGINNNKGFNFSEAKLESGNVDDLVVYSSGIGMQCIFPSRISESQHVRVVLSFAPIFGGRRIEIKFGKGRGRSALYNDYTISEMTNVQLA